MKYFKQLLSKNPHSTAVDKKITGNFLNGCTIIYIENLYKEWQQNCKSVDPSWDLFFRQNISEFETKLKIRPIISQTKLQVTGTEMVDWRVNMIIDDYQKRGHLQSSLDPLNIWRSPISLNDSSYFKTIEQSKLDDSTAYRIPATSFIADKESALSIKKILERLHKTYCGNIGFEICHIYNREKLQWLKHKIETPNSFQILNKVHKTEALKRLTKTHLFERFLAKKWPTEKRFGLEGCEALIPAIMIGIDVATELGMEQINFGMAHRGRLSVITQVLQKPLSNLFALFGTFEPDPRGPGDVKYHTGSYSKLINSHTGKSYKCSLVCNPSHLEVAYPVTLGKTKGDQTKTNDKNKIWSVIMHGDSALAGQGVIYETLNMCNLKNFSVGGSIHIIINNQIGFTTDLRKTRRSEYVSDLSKVVSVPCFHVNAEDIDSVLFVMLLAAQYKHKFKEDVFIDLIGYRLNGHNETDDPRYTQPKMYKAIAKRPSVYNIYLTKLIEENVVKKEEISDFAVTYEKEMEAALKVSEQKKIFNYDDWADSEWDSEIKENNINELNQTGVSKEMLLQIANIYSTIPSKFKLHRTLQRIYKQRVEMIQSNNIDWAIGEALGIGSILMEGVSVRFIGEDVERGTFNHRHHVLHDQETGETYNPLLHLSKDQASYVISNSPLSEYGVVGFEYGFTRGSPKTVCIWEAQFGDFINTAQCILDQYLACARHKWGQQSGLILFLPHGMEAQGPEHSSGRPERFLQLCNDNEFKPIENPLEQLKETNWIIANVTTPVNLFHLIRRQSNLGFYRPLILFTPKSLLRHPLVKSKFDDMLKGTKFRPYIEDKDIKQNSQVEKLLLCCGKVYYDLLEARQNRKLQDKVAIARVEQICPFPYIEFKADAARFQNSEVYWVQEEHKNQGWWIYVRSRIQNILGDKAIKYIGRQPSSSPATGYKITFNKEKNEFINDAFKF